MAEEEDRISALPDCLLLEIISQIKIDKVVKYHEKEEERIMTTKEVIKTTSTLSKRWQHLWSKVSNLIFIDNYDVSIDIRYADLTDYFLFISRTLTQYSADVNLNKLTLDIYHIYGKKVNIQFLNNLIRYAIEHHKVQQVDFKLNKFSHDDDLFFNNSCFICMKLSTCVLNPIGVISWKSLMSLCVSEVKLDEDMIEKILSGSPDNIFSIRTLTLPLQSLLFFPLLRK